MTTTREHSCKKHTNLLKDSTQILQRLLCPAGVSIQRLKSKSPLRTTYTKSDALNLSVMRDFVFDV